MRPLMTPEQVARALAHSVKWVYRNKHLIGYHSVGIRGVRFDPQDVEQYRAKTHHAAA